MFGELIIDSHKKDIIKVALNGNENGDISKLDDMTKTIIMDIVDNSKINDDKKNKIKLFIKKDVNGYNKTNLNDLLNLMK